ncbi:hypothetical protein A3753_25480 [Sulfitobacter sp. HI0082]|nr:hypothetical protein A3753_18485 [Sulfitobacter sp. HI0082]KZZ30443.1 hypothetical protein A3753_25480 [Sulfitobacter sp. HI0082]
MFFRRAVNTTVSDAAVQRVAQTDLNVAPAAFASTGAMPTSVPAVPMMSVEPDRVEVTVNGGAILGHGSDGIVLSRAA